jgi:hypothetical protein
LKDGRGKKAPLTPALSPPRGEGAISSNFFTRFYSPKCIESSRQADFLKIVSQDLFTEGVDYWFGMVNNLVGGLQNA